MWLKGLGKWIEIIHLIGSQTRDLPACSIVMLWQLKFPLQGQFYGLVGSRKLSWPI
jgi:hypothetical protein